MILVLGLKIALEFCLGCYQVLTDLIYEIFFLLHVELAFTDLPQSRWLELEQTRIAWSALHSYWGRPSPTIVRISEIL